MWKRLDFPEIRKQKSRKKHCRTRTFFFLDCNKYCLLFIVNDVLSCCDVACDLKRAGENPENVLSAVTYQTQNACHFALCWFFSRQIFAQTPLHSATGSTALLSQRLFVVTLVLAVSSTSSTTPPPFSVYKPISSPIHVRL